jgi:hypothetical protein
MTEAIEQEEILGKAYDLGLIRRLWQFIIPYKRLFILSLLLLPLQQAFGLAQPYLMKWASIGTSRAKTSGACKTSCCSSWSH